MKELARGIAIAVLVGLFFPRLLQARTNAEDFPLVPGTYWIYQGFVRSSVQGSENGKTTRVTWKTEVMKVVVHGGLTIAVVKGMPGDLDWSEGNATPKLSVIIRSGDSKFYLIENDEAKSLINQIDNPAYGWAQVPIDDDAFLQLPLSQGKRFCDPGAMQRDDGEYCWVTGPSHELALTGVRGIPPGKHIAYPVRFVTNPDDTEFEFVPGIGMVSYGYHHHGTVADTELHLIEFHDGASTH
ncbi:MAG TPA: hypothetical protein VHX36_11275 [Candidatus Acidoferrales bacterium]|jgi:hypothetical protein|nr:hypothetical protein [Candidatus Acidoferrales bacterium]